MLKCAKKTQASPVNTSFQALASVSAGMTYTGPTKPGGENVTLTGTAKVDDLFRPDFLPTKPEISHYFFH